MNRNIFLCFLFTLLLTACSHKMQQQGSKKLTAGNPVFQGWYADPEGTIFNKEYWIYPTYSAPYNEQVFFDAFFSKDLVNWNKHSRILDTESFSKLRKLFFSCS